MVLKKEIFQNTFQSLIEQADNFEDYQMITQICSSNEQLKKEVYLNQIYSSLKEMELSKNTNFLYKNLIDVLNSLMVLNIDSALSNSEVFIQKIVEFLKGIFNIF